MAGCCTRIELFVVGKEMKVDGVSIEQISDVFRIANELNRAQDRALRHTAVHESACNFLLVINSNFGDFRDIDAFSSKMACFPIRL